MRLYLLDEHLNDLFKWTRIAQQGLEPGFFKSSYDNLKKLLLSNTDLERRYGASFGRHRYGEAKLLTTTIVDRAGVQGVDFLLDMRVDLDSVQPVVLRLSHQHFLVLSRQLVESNDRVQSPVRYIHRHCRQTMCVKIHSYYYTLGIANLFVC